MFHGCVKQVFFCWVRAFHVNLGFVCDTYINIMYIHALYTQCMVADLVYYRYLFVDTKFDKKNCIRQIGLLLDFDK